MRALRSAGPILGAVLAAVVVVALVVTFWPRQQQKTLVADFPRTVSLYQGSDVRILGVPVGTVTSVTPAGTHVVVRMQYDAKYAVPADAKAAIVSPSIVGDRFVQLTPVYRGGPQLRNGAHLGLNRTATPLELDQIYGSLNDLNKALGPQGANQNGALSRLLQTTAANFGGQGAQFHRTIQNLGHFTQTLADNKDALFGTTRDIETFVSALSKNDSTVRRFNDSLAAGSQVLAGERRDLGAALHNLAIAMTQVRSFVHQNRDALSTNIKGLTQLSQILVKRRAALNEVLQVAPDALNNLGLAYNSRVGTLNTRANVGETVNQLTADPTTVLCTFLGQAPGGNKACKDLTKSLNLKALGRPAALGGGTAAGNRTVLEPVDRTLGGLVEVHR
ncbi:MAG TPA: MCE family protein [Marmoricola sp.]|nr:MCE family protein [Marmoricola sp.]